MNYFKEHKANIMFNPELREPQKDAYLEALKHFYTGENFSEEKENPEHAIIVLPTGTGKSGLISILPYNISNGKVLIISPRLIINEGLLETIDAANPDNFYLKRKIFNDINDCPVVIEYNNNTGSDVVNMADIVVINIHKLQERLENSPINMYPRNYFDLIIIDEAHHAPAETWQKTLEHFSNAKVIKLTATPKRDDEVVLEGKIIYDYPLSVAMSEGYVKSLQKFDFVPEELKLTMDNDTSKEYTVEEILNKNLKNEEWISRSVAYSKNCNESIVNLSIEHLKNKRAHSKINHKIIAVACSIEHAYEIKNLYTSKNINAEVIHSRLEDSEKDKIKDGLKNNSIEVIINVDMLKEGFDHKELSIAAIFRPYRSSLPYEQFIGRILRTVDSDLPEDNIGEVITHHHLYLDPLWEIYKKEINKKVILDEFKEIIKRDTSIKDTIERSSLGLVNQSNEYTINEDVAYETELISEYKKSKKEYEETAKKLRAMFPDKTDDEIQEFLDSNDKEKPKIIRPDKYKESERKSLDNYIKKEIVPEIIQELNLDLHSDEIKIIFEKKFVNYKHIINMGKNNGGMLVIFINTIIKKHFGVRDTFKISTYQNNAVYDLINNLKTTIIDTFNKLMI